MIARNTVDFRRMITGNRFWYGVEVPTAAGIGAPDSASQLIRLVQEVIDDPHIGWACITGKAHGSRIVAPDYLLGTLPERASDRLLSMLSENRSRIVSTLTCRDGNRYGLSSSACWRSTVQGFHNVLAVTGEYPIPEIVRIACPVFDLDSLSLISLLRSLNERHREPGWEKLPRTDLFIGCVVSPFKRHESELLPQYFKLVRKILAGAHWVIPQLGYDMRKFNEVKLFLAHNGLDVPVIGNVFVLTREAARLFNTGRRPGCVVSDELLELADRYGAGADKGRKFFHELAAKQLAVFEGLGFAGGYLGGVSQAEAFSHIIESAESFGPDDWRDFITEIQFAQRDEYFLFEHDPKTALSDATRINPEYSKSPETPRKSRQVTLGYRLARQVHKRIVLRQKGLFAAIRRICFHRDKRPGILGRLACWLEYAFKSIAYGCRDCGNCCLHECAYLCPVALCPKHSGNGPCDESVDGKCPLDTKPCVWVRVYERLKHYGETKQLLKRDRVFLAGSTEMYLKE